MVSYMLIKSISARTRLVPCLLCAAGLLALVLPGCRKGEEAVEPVVADPLVRALVTRDGIAERMHAILDETRVRLPGADAAALKAALAKNAEWVRLEKEFSEMSARADALRQSASGAVERAEGKISK